MTTLTLSGNEEICEIRTSAFNAHDLDRLADVLADEIVFRAPGRRVARARQRASRSTRTGSPTSRTPSST